MQVTLDISHSSDPRDDLHCIHSAYDGLAAMANTAAESPHGGNATMEDIAALLVVINSLHKAIVAKV